MNRGRDASESNGQPQEIHIETVAIALQELRP